MRHQVQFILQNIRAYKNKGGQTNTFSIHHIQCYVIATIHFTKQEIKIKRSDWLINILTVASWTIHGLTFISITT